MKILYINRKDCQLNKGGDTIQMLNTKKYLEKNYNLKIEIWDNDENEKIKNADFIHIFNLQTIKNCMSAFEICRNYNKKVILSPIFWDLTSSLFVNNYFKLFNNIPGEISSKIEYFPTVFKKNTNFIFKYKPNIMHNYRNEAKFILENVDLILPNSFEEADLLCKIFGIDQKEFNRKTNIIPNAVDLEFVNNSDKINYDLKDFVLQVGRIEPTKNQLSVVMALFNEPKIPIVFVGGIGNEKYFKKLQLISQKRGQVFFVNEINNKEVYSFYNNAKCHVMPSFRESPGLSSLEAMLCGTPVVVSCYKYCPVDYYYFSEFGHLCNPYSVKSIRKSIMNALKKEKYREVSDCLKNKFTYENAARLTYHAYLKMIKQD